jgi:hypothetical protein
MDEKKNQARSVLAEVTGSTNLADAWADVLASDAVTAMLEFAEQREAEARRAALEEAEQVARTIGRVNRSAGAHHAADRIATLKDNTQ